MGPSVNSGFGASGGRRTGLADRLFHHSSGRRSGDQFCVYVADRLVLPKLTAENLAGIAGGHLLLDDFVYVYVQDRLAYRVTITADVAAARAVEKAARGGALGAGKPVLNLCQRLRACPRKLGPRKFGSVVSNQEAVQRKKEMSRA